ncbi:MAG: TIGR03643 family protein [Aureliella sp.]
MSEKSKISGQVSSSVLPPSGELTRGEVDRIIMMAWEDRTSFDAIREQFGLSPGDVIKLMRREMKPSSFKTWRKRTQGRVTKHEAKFAESDAGEQTRRFRAKSQRG